MTDLQVAVVSARRFMPNTQSEAWGYFCDCVLALGASVSFASARGGVLTGLTPGDLILMRFGVAGVVLLPFWVHWGLPTLAGIGWRRGLILTALGGPAFALMQMGGYAPEHAPMFDQMVAKLRATHEWTFIDREVDIRLERFDDVSATS